MIERLRLNQTNRPLDVVLHWHENGDLNLNPPYQRGDVWGPIRRVNLIRSVLLGIPIPSIIINDRFAADWGEQYSVIDGKQRITALLMFLESQLPIPGEWVGFSQSEVSFSELDKATQRHIRHKPIAFSEGQLASIEDEKEVFELVNFGGVPQGESDQ